MEYDIEEKNGQIKVGEKAIALMKRYQSINLEAAKMKMEMDGFKAAMTKAMGEAGVKQFKNDFVTINYFPESEKTIVDTDALKEQGLYESFTKKSHVSAHVSIKFHE